MNALTWVLIAVCISQSAMFSGLNLAFFSISKLRLEVEAAGSNRSAVRVLAMRRDSNLLLVTILWGNVAVNVLLALLSGSVLSGVAAFLFSTVLITLVGEIMPQAYFSRHALNTASFLSPVLRFYQVLLFPIAKPTALLLDRWFGPEAVQYYRENDLRELIKMQVVSPETDVDRVEGRGALNFLKIDDLPVEQEGEIIDPESILKLEFRDGRPLFPAIRNSASDEFLKQVNSSRKKWVILVDSADEPQLALKSDEFIRGALLDEGVFNPYLHCHRPIILRDGKTSLGEAIPLLQVHAEKKGDDVIDNDVIILWGGEKRIITGADILGRLLRGISQNYNVSFRRYPAAT